MSFVPVSPLPLDFCGRPPCPKCFQWMEGDKPPLSGLHKMAIDLLQKPLDDLSKEQRKELDSVARKIHKDGLEAFASPPEESPPPPADIGMSEIRALQGWLKERRRVEPPKPRQLTCDEICARKAEQEVADKARKKERDERMKEARELAKIFAEANQDPDQRRQYEEQQMLRGVDPSFIDYCRSRGIYSPQEIYSRWQREYGGIPNYMGDPSRIPFGYR